MVSQVTESQISLSKAEKIGFTVSIVTLLALTALASMGICNSHPLPWLKMGKRASFITTCLAGGGLALILGILGLRVLLKQKPQPSHKNSATVTSNMPTMIRPQLATPVTSNMLPLHKLILESDRDQPTKIRDYLKTSKEVDINARDSHGCTALHRAVIGYHAPPEDLAFL